MSTWEAITSRWKTSYIIVFRLINLIQHIGQRFEARSHCAIWDCDLVLLYNGLHRIWWCCRSRTVWALPLNSVQPICCNKKKKKNRSRSLNQKKAIHSVNEPSLLQEQYDYFTLINLHVFPLRDVESKGPFALDDNDVNFSCYQKWVAWLPMVLFTFDDKDKIIHYYCCQCNPFLSCLLVRTVPKLKGFETEFQSYIPDKYSFPVLFSSPILCIP